MVKYSIIEYRTYKVELIDYLTYPAPEMGATQHDITKYGLEMGSFYL